MLTSLLPGLRHVRGPIAAGGLLVATAYMLLVSRIDAATDLNGDVGRGFTRLDEQLGRSGWLLVASLAAYLIGSIYVSMANWIAHRGSIRWTRRMVRNPENLLEPSFSSRRPFTRLSLQRLVRLHDRIDEPSEPDPAKFAARICWDIVQDDFGARLLSVNRDLFGEYDRQRSEAEFRYAVALPLVGAAIALLANLDISASTGAVVFLAVLALSSGLIYTARTQSRAARSLYAHAVANGLVATTTIDSEPEPPDAYPFP